MNRAWIKEGMTEGDAVERVRVAVSRVQFKLGERFGVEVDDDEAWFDVLSDLTPVRCHELLNQWLAGDMCPGALEFVGGGLDGQEVGFVGDLPVSNKVPNYWAWRLVSLTAARHLIRAYTVHKMRVHSAVIEYHLNETKKLVVRDGVLAVGGAALFAVK